MPKKCRSFEDHWRLDFLQMRFGIIVSAAVLVFSGCATLFGWDIHAPAVLSQRFYSNVSPVDQRIGVYLDPALFDFVSTNKGGRFADPQTYYIGEAFIPILIEGFQQGFSEFVLIESEPTREMLTGYAVPYLVYVRPKAFFNDVNLKGQSVSFETEALVFDPELNLLDRFKNTGTSDAKRVFAKKGGPQINLNAALENNIETTVLHIQNAIQSKRWVRGGE